MTNDGTLYNNGTLNTAGWLNNNGSLNNYSGGSLSNFGSLTNKSGGTLNNSGTLTNNRASPLVNHGTLNNSGTLKNYSGGTYEEMINFGTLNNSGTLTNEIGGTLVNSGSIHTTSGTFTNNGTYTGSGHISGSWTDHGHIKPGHSAGVMTMDGNYYKRAGSKEIELGGHFHGGGDNSLTEFDWLDVTGDVELAGVLDVYLIDSFELLAGMSFDILKVGGTLTGQYDGLDEGRKVGSFSGTNLYITYAGGNGNDVTLFSRAVPEPAAILLALLGLAMLPRRRRR